MIYTKEMYDSELKTKGYTLSYKTNPTCIETVGFRETQEKFELQIKLEKEQDELIPIIREIAEQYSLLDAKKTVGLVDIHISSVNGVILKYTATEDDKVYIRCVLPDENGKYPWNEGCDPLYKNQWDSNDDDNYCTIVRLVHQFGFRWINEAEASGRRIIY